MTPEIIKGLSYDEYVKLPGLRFSDAKGFRRTALHARFEMLKPSADTASTIIGTALHTAVLEPERFTDQYAVAPKLDKRTAAGKIQWAEFERDNPDKIVLRQDEFDLVLGMSEAVLHHPFVQRVLPIRSHREVVIRWMEGNVLCKCRIDWVVQDESTFSIDLKSTKDASPEEFSRSILKYGYHAQQASYRRALQVVAPITAERRCLLIAVENTEPHGVAIYELSDAALHQGEQEYLGWVQQFAHASKLNDWPGYTQLITPIDLPKWAQRMEE